MRCLYTVSLRLPVSFLNQRDPFHAEGCSQLVKGLMPHDPATKIDGRWHQQQPDWSAVAGPQLHSSISFPLSAAMNMAVAQPTPLSTDKAPVAQFCRQAPHSMQADGWAIFTIFPLGSNTPWGQTWIHILQPLQSSGERTRVFSR